MVQSITLVHVNLGSNIDMWLVLIAKDHVPPLCQYLVNSINDREGVFPWSYKDTMDWILNYAIIISFEEGFHGQII